MTYATRDYIDAFEAVINTSASERHTAIIKRLYATMKKYGDHARFGAVAEAIEERIARDKGGHVVLVESSRVLPQKLFHEITKRCGARDIVRTRVTPGIVGGVRITIDGDREIDHSVRHALRTL